MPPEPDTPRRWNMFALGCATLASMSTILMGYNLALMSGAQLFIREDLGLTDVQIEVLTGSMNLFMLVSIFGAGWAADRLGRRGTLVLANAFLMAGAAAMSFGGSFVALMGARFVTSIGVGFARVVAPVYNAEISPASTRGVLSSLLDMFVSVGFLLSYVSNYAFADLPVHVGWRVMFAAGALPPVFIAAGVLFFMPESPRWLVMRERDDEARMVLVRTSDTAGDADLRLQEIKQATVDEAPPAQAPAADSVWKEMLLRPSKSVRRILVCVVGLQLAQKLSGIDAIMVYSPLVFKKVGISSNSAILGATIGMGVVRLCSIIVATLLSDRVGRRPLLLASTGGAAVALTSLALSLYIGGSSGGTVSSAVRTAACVVFVLAIVATVSVGLGPVVPTYSSEILPLRLRAQGTSLAAAVNRMTSALVTMTFISLADGITMHGCFFLFAAMAAAALVFVYLRLPETRGRSLEDMDVLFAK